MPWWGWVLVTIGSLVVLVPVLGMLGLWFLAKMMDPRG